MIESRPERGAALSLSAVVVRDFLLCVFINHESSYSTASTHTNTNVGTPPPGYNQGSGLDDAYRALTGFPSLSTVRGESVDSPECMRFGHQWYLELTPGGDEDQK